MYTTVIHPLRKALNLSLTEYCVLDTIRNLSNNKEFGGWCVAKRQSIAENLDISLRTVKYSISKLADMGLLERNEDQSSIRTIDAFNRLFTMNVFALSVDEMMKISPEVFQQGVQNLHGGVQKLHGKGAKFAPLYNNIYNNNYKEEIYKEEILNPGLENQVSVKKDIVSVQVLVDYINKKHGRGFKNSKSLQSKLNARLKEKFTIEEILSAVDNAYSSQYHIDTRFKYLTPEFFLRPDKINMYLNAIDSSNVGAPAGYVYQTDGQWKGMYLNAEGNVWSPKKSL